MLPRSWYWEAHGNHASVTIPVGALLRRPGEGNLQPRLDQRAPKGHAPRLECEAPRKGYSRQTPPVIPPDTARPERPTDDPFCGRFFAPITPSRSRALNKNVEPHCLLRCLNGIRCRRLDHGQRHGRDASGFDGQQRENAKSTICCGVSGRNCGDDDWLGVCPRLGRRQDVGLALTNTDSQLCAGVPLSRSQS